MDLSRGWDIASRPKKLVTNKVEWPGHILWWLATCVSGNNDNLHWPVMREGFEICFVVSRDPTQPRLFLFISGVALPLRAKPRAPLLLLL